jgi:hypothetical protein
MKKKRSPFIALSPAVCEKCDSTAYVIDQSR